MKPAITAAFAAVLVQRAPRQCRSPALETISARHCPRCDEDEIFSLNADGSGVTQLTPATGTRSVRARTGLAAAPALRLRGSAFTSG
jgi:hypothetical protein